MKPQIEAILFAAGEPVDVSKLAKFLEVDKEEVSTTVKELGSFYEQNGSGLQIVQKGSKIQLVSNKDQGELVAKFLNRKMHEPLSKAALEVLAVVAYRGPVTRAQIEHVRGVNCSFTLRNLAMRGLIERKDNPADSRSYIYKPSFDMLKSLGIKKIKELPDYELLSEETKEEQEKTKKE